MAKTKEITIGEQKFTLQSVSPSWYYDFNRVSAEYVESGEQMMSAQDANASKKVSKSQTKSTTADGLHTTVSQTISSSAYSSYVNSYANKAASSSGPSGRTTRAYSAA